ncbi:D-arabinono-1,4-lactone oxidase [Microbacterium sp.]|uniref:D-arabinono-1,4-lactone oxidase n=1 Tax=Microbacterium sp. TaxID=51671 RepID=UPI0028123537|nr:D-arabinono-1,4-lactone oxidase [Microbacterium sp.]
MNCPPTAAKGRRSCDTTNSRQERVAAFGHYEFYRFPHTDVALTKRQTRMPGSAAHRPLPRIGRWMEETLLSNGVYRVACATGRVLPVITPPFNRLAVRLTGDREYTDRGWRIEFPVEVRFAASDDLWMSTASGRDTAYIAVHRYWRADPQPYFDAVEQIMLEHAGRPHWGKLHGPAADQLRARNPRFHDFVAPRDRLDPSRLFGNRRLERILGR